jgi:hypothetical protein
MCWIEKERVEVNKNYLSDVNGLEFSLIDKYLCDFNLSCPEIIDDGKTKNGLPRVTLILRGDSTDIEKFKRIFWN